MNIHLEHLLVQAKEVEQFVDRDYAIYQSGTLLTLTNIDTYERITIFFYPLDRGVQGFIQTVDEQPFDPFYLQTPIEEAIYFQTEHYNCSLRYYPLEYCRSKGEYPVELSVSNISDDMGYSIEVSFDGKARMFQH